MGFIVTSSVLSVFNVTKAKDENHQGRGDCSKGSSCESWPRHQHLSTGMMTADRVAVSGQLIFFLICVQYVGDVVMWLSPGLYI